MVKNKFAFRELFADGLSIPAPHHVISPAMTNALLTYLRGGRGRASKLAEKVGIGRGYLSEIANGKKPGSVAVLQAISVETGIPISALMADAHGPINVPLLSWISAGSLGEQQAIEDESITDYIPASGLPPGDWVAFRVEGSSMNRISPPESIIFVNRRERQLVPNACYVVADHDGRATYKRYRPDPARFEPVSTEDGHDPIIIDNSPTIVGRVRRSVIDM